MTEWEGQTRKYLAQGHLQGLRIVTGTKYFPVLPNLTQSVSTLSYDQFKTVYS